MSIEKQYFVTDEVEVDFSLSSSSVTVVCPQYENSGRAISVKLKRNGEDFDVPDGVTPHVYELKFDGKVVDNICEYDGNVVMIEITRQMSFASGKNVLKVALVEDGTGRICQTASIYLLIVAGPDVQGIEQSEDEFKAMEQILEQVTGFAQRAEDAANAAESVKPSVDEVLENLDVIQASSVNAQAAKQSADDAAESARAAAESAEHAQQIAQGALGWYESYSKLKAAYPVGSNGQWAIIGDSDTVWTWDADTQDWVNTNKTPDLSQFWTKDQSDQRYASAEQGSRADTAVQTVNGKSGREVNLVPDDIGAAGKDAGVALYVHSRSGTVNNLQGSGTNGRAKITAEIQAGDTWTVNGEEVVAYMGAGDATEAMSGESYSGKWVTFVHADGVVNFKGGGGVNPSKATATPEQVLAPATFFAGGKELQTGTMTDLAGATVTGDVDTSGSYLRLQPQSEGRVNATSYVRAAFSDVRSAINLTADKIVSGNTILGIAGTGGASVKSSGTLKVAYNSTGTLTVPDAYKLLFVIVAYCGADWGIQPSQGSVTANSGAEKIIDVADRSNGYEATAGVSGATALRVAVFKNHPENGTYAVALKSAIGIVYWVGLD